MIRKLMKEEYKNAINLSYQVCIECGINDFTEEGIETFKSFVYDTSLMNTLDIYGAFDNHLLIGIIGVHRERQHISLFFVLSHYHRQGIGKSNFVQALVEGKINYTPVYLLTALLILAAAATALVIRKQHRNKTDRPQK